MLGFTWQELTTSLLKVPYMPGAVGRLGLFETKRQLTTIANIEVQGERLALVPDLPRGAPPTPNVEDRPFMVAFRIPHFPIRDVIYADAVQDQRGFGEQALQSFRNLVNERTASLGRRLDVTLEHLRLGAVTGEIITAVDRETGAPLRSVNLFEHFGVAPQAELEWPIIGAGAIGQENPAWAGQLTELINHVSRKMADEVGGNQLFGIHAFCGSVFFDAVTQHPERRASFIAIDNAPLQRPLLGTQSSWRNVTFEEYRGRIGGVPFVKPDECHFFPVGIPDLFVEAYAPADYVESVNTLALPRYLKSEPMQFDKGVMLEAQQNVLPLCTSPRVLFSAKAVAYETTSAVGEPVRAAA